jgi:hypothetical protein
MNIRGATPIVLTEVERAVLEGMLQSPKTEQRLAEWARIIVPAVDEKPHIQALERAGAGAGRRASAIQAAMLARHAGSASVGSQVIDGNDDAKKTACSPLPEPISRTSPRAGKTSRSTARIGSRFRSVAGAYRFAVSDGMGSTVKRRPHSETVDEGRVVHSPASRSIRSRSGIRGGNSSYTTGQTISGSIWS